MQAHYQCGRSELSGKKRRAMGNCLALLLLLLCFSLVACEEKVDYSKPTPEKFEPPGPTVPEAQVIINKAFPSPLTCGEPYKITAKVQEKNLKTCEGYNFANLYKLATKLINDKITELHPSCPTECSPVKQIATAVKWQCSNEIATLDLQVSLICPKSDTKLPKGLELDPDKSPEDFKKKEYTVDPDSELGKKLDELDMVITQTEFTSRECKAELYQVYYSESLANFADLINPKDCSGLKNKPVYQAYAAKGKAQAEKFFGTFTCNIGCRKLPFKVLKQQWGCDKDAKSVWVRTWFNVECVPNK